MTMQLILVLIAILCLPAVRVASRDFSLQSGTLDTLPLPQSKKLL